MESNVDETKEGLAAEFNSSAFMQEELINNEQGNSDISTEEGDTGEEGEGTPSSSVGEESGDESEETGSSEEGSDEEESYWSLQEESKDDSENEGKNDAEENESEDSGDSLAWNTIAEELGIDADDYDTFIDTLKTQKQAAQLSATNEKIDALTNIISFNDEKLMREELKARGFSADEIEDEIDILIENNTIRSEARKVRKSLENIVAQEKDAIANQTQNEDAMRQEELEKARRELQTYMSTTNEMFGGKVNSKQKEQHIEYISSGDFFEEVTQTPESMAQAAWLWRYRNQILNSMKSNGFEKGKSAILDKMTNPEPTRRTNIPDPETGHFNPSRFMDSEQM